MIHKLLPTALFIAVTILLASCGGASSSNPASTIPVTQPSTSNPFPSDIASENGNNVDSPLGTNSDYVKYWTREWVFVDAFKSSREWFSGSTNGTWNDGRTLDLDANGWVRSLQSDQVARTTMFIAHEGHFPGGQYTVLYDGEGTLEYGNGATFNASLSQSGRHVIDVNPAQNGITLTLSATNPANPLRNIRVIMPGGVCSDNPYQACSSDNDCSNGASCDQFVDNYQTQIFHPTFLNRLKRYSVFRFMNMMRVNDYTDQRDWASRPTPQDAQWTSPRGLSVEVMVALANRLHANPWFSIPHQASDNYVRQFAQAVRDNLAPDLKVYIEYSNEVWNSNFAQFDYATQQGLALNLSTDPDTARIRFYSRRAVQIFDIFTSVFGDNSRLVRVMASKATNPWLSRQLLEYNNAYQKTDALAIAPYFGHYLGRPTEQSRVEAMTLDELMAELRDVAVPAAIDNMINQAAVANEFRIPMIAYEGGQHLVGGGSVRNSNTINTLFDAANRDPRMESLYTTYLNAWRDNGGQLFVHYRGVGEYGIYGRWGSLEYQDQPASTAPKFRALMNFIENNPRWW